MMKKRNNTSVKHILDLLLLVTVIYLVTTLNIVATAENQPAPLVQLLKPTQTGNYVTQTVYGFLDFTTTIGNTIMVFSPQSIPSDPKPTVLQMQVNTVIETKPHNTPILKETQIDMKPTKTISPTNSENKKNSPFQSSNPPMKKISLAVQVKSESKMSSVVSSIVHLQNIPKSVEVNVIEGTKKFHDSSQIMSSKVEIVASMPKPKYEENEHVHLPSPKPKLSTKVNIVSSQVQTVEGLPKLTSTKSNIVHKSSPIIDIHSEKSISIIGNNIGDPEYDFLSRQPSEFVEETFRVVNLKPGASKFHLKPRSNSLPPLKRSDSIHPTGLVTKMGGTVVKDGATTVHETSVIGTYISGKYAQVLQSTSHIYQNKPKPSPSSSLRILKTAAPLPHKQPKYNTILDPTPVTTLHDETLNLPLEALFSSVQSSNLVRPSRRPAVSGPGNFKNRFKGRSNHFDSDKDQEIDDNDEEQDSSNQNSYKKSSKHRGSSGRQTFKNSKFSRPSSSHKLEIPTVSVFSEHFSPSLSSRRHYQSSSRRSNFRPPVITTSSSSYTENNGGYTRRGYKPRIQASTVEHSTAASTSVYKFKLNRSPGRWQYKTTPKPRVTIRRQGEDELDNVTLSTPISLNSVNTDPSTNWDGQPASQARSDDTELEPSASSNNLSNAKDDNSSTENKIGHQPLPALETIKVDISTPPDFKDIYYEIATIKSPYTFQVGSVKNTRYITVTSTIEKTLIEPTETAVANVFATEPLTENILATTSYIDKEHNLLDSSIATLPPLSLGSEMSTPPLETLTETFSTTNEMLKTHILPVVHGINDTTKFTLVQTYHITRFVTATKTLPPMEVYQFVPSKTLKEFNTRLDEAGSEHHLELEFGDQNDEDDENISKRIKLPSDLNLANVGSEFDLSDSDLSKFPDEHLRLRKAHLSTTPKPESITTPGLSPDQVQQLALLRFLNPQAQIPQVITTSKPIVKFETVYESHIIPIFNGVSTSLSTLSRPIATVSKTEYEYGTSTLAVPLPPIPTIPSNPLLPAQFTVTSTPIVTQTMLTETDSKVLKLTFGAKTAYTTLFSTKVIPTVLTTYLTTQVPVAQPTAAFPGFFPAAYPPFPYVG